MRYATEALLLIRAREVASYAIREAQMVKDHLFAINDPSTHICMQRTILLTEKLLQLKGPEV